MNFLLVFVFFLWLPGSVNAECYGSDSLKNCYDDSGNSYSIQKIGNTTYVDGYNYNTGSTWDETAQHIGNSTYIDGTDSDNRSWNETIQHFGELIFIDGTDSNGNSFSTICINGECD